MKLRHTCLLLIPALLFLSCSKKRELPFTETITKGGLWGIRIGSSAADVYSQLQAAGPQKGFGQVAVVTRQYYDNPKQIENLLPYYNGLTLMSNEGIIFQAQIAYNNDHITWIYAGGGLPEQVAKWPNEANDETAIHENDPVSGLYTKLVAIHQMPAYNTFKLIIPDKPLDKPYDTDMANYDQWALSFSTRISTSVRGNTSVRFYFKGGRLDRIVHQYNEGVVYN